MTNHSHNIHKLWKIKNAKCCSIYTSPNLTKLFGIQNFFFQDSKAGSNINFQKSLEISWAAPHIVQSMPSKKTINETKNKKTKKIKLRLQPIYIFNLLSMLRKSFCTTFCHFKKSKFSFTKTSRWKFFDLQPTHFAVRITAPVGNNCFTVAELDERRCTLEIHLSKSVNNRNNVFFWKLEKRSQWCCWFADLR